MICPLCQSDNPAQSQRCRACGAPLKTRADASSAAPDALSDGVLLAGTYAVEEVLGQGGFGITYRCHDQMLDRRVAVKEFFPSGCRRQNTEVQASRGLSDANFREARAQFLAEARTLARCHHVGIVGVHAAFEANQTAYMVMELLHGHTLAQLLSARGGRMNEAEAVGVIERVGEALQFVHEQNLLHRDIKPDNIIVCDDGRVMLIDFGTARETVQGQVQGQTVVVTPGYAPLEQYARQARRGAFTDVYSLAATLYHLLSGQMPPAASDRAMGVMLRPVREFNPQISASVARAVESALQMEIAKRPQSVREFLDLLRAPVEEVEAESYFSPQPPDVARDEDENELDDEIASTLAPDALRARQSSWYYDAEVTGSKAQPVKLAPPRAFAGANIPPDASTISHLSLGGINVRNANAPDKSGNGSWWGFAVFIGFVGFIALINSGGQQRAATPPSFGVPSDYSPSSPNFSPPFVPADNQDNAKRQAATRDWNALAVLQPASIQILPDSKKSGATKNIDWRGAVEFSPDGKRMAYVDGQSTLQILSLPDRKLVHSVALDPKLIAIDAVFSADNETVAVAQAEKSASLSAPTLANRIGVWSVRSGEKIGTFATASESDSVWPQVVFNSGELLVRKTSYSPTTTPVLFKWNPKTGKRSKSPISTIDYANWGYGVAAPDGKQFVVGDTLGRLSWLDFNTGKHQHEQTTKLTQGDYQQRFDSPFFSDAVNSVLGVRGIDYSLDGSVLASRNAGEIRVFDSKAKEIGSLPIGDQNSMFFSVSPAGKWVAAQGNLPCSPEGMLLWNVKMGQKIRLGSPFDTLRDFSFSQDGKQLYGIFTQDGKFQFVTWNVNAKPSPLFLNPTETVLQLLSVDVSPHTPLAQNNEKFALYTGLSVAISPKNGGSLVTLPLKNSASNVVELGLSPDGQFLAARKLDGVVELWNVKASKLVFQSQVVRNDSPQQRDSAVSPENFHDVAFSSDNRLCAYARPNGNSSIVELRTVEAAPRLVASFLQNNLVTALKFSPDNKALICGDDKGGVQWFDVATRKLSDAAQTGEAVFDIAFGARNLVVIGSSSTRLYKVPANANKPLQSAVQSKLPSAFDTGRDAYTQSAISPDGKLLATDQGSESVQVWDLTTGTKLQDVQRNMDGAALVYGLKFSADSNQLSAIGQKINNRQIFSKTWTRVKTK